MHFKIKKNNNNNVNAMLCINQDQVQVIKLPFQQ